MFRLAWTSVAIAALCCLTSFAADDDAAKKESEKKVQAATAVAEKWLALIDEGKYADGWKQGAEALRTAVKEEDFDKAMQAARKPLGKLVSRKVKSATYATELPGAPDGEYVVLQFDTSFENKKTAVETVTPMLDKDGKWHVSGYFIK